MLCSDIAMSVQKAPTEDTRLRAFAKEDFKLLCLYPEEGREKNRNQGIYKISNLVIPIFYAWLHHYWNLDPTTALEICSASSTVPSESSKQS